MSYVSSLISYIIINCIVTNMHVKPNYICIYMCVWTFTKKISRDLEILLFSIMLKEFFFVCLFFYIKRKEVLITMFI